jgi:SAM-dependent methyltransferase
MHDRQEKALRDDGDGYHSRNYAGIGTIADPVFDQMALLHQVRPTRSVLEIGCTTGFRLEKARQAFNAECAGLEVSPAAVDEGRARFPKVQLELGLAPRDLSRWAGREFDVVVVGHFQYLLPREELFGLAAAVDSLVAPGGHIIVMDFLHPHPVSATYTHHADLTVFKHDPSAPWMWSPTYTLVSRQVYNLADDARTGRDPRAWQTVDVMRKLTVGEAYPRMVSLPSVHEGESSA